MKRRVITSLILGTMLTGSWALASDDQPAPLRVTYVEGKAAYEPAGEVQWSELTANLPLLSGDRIITQPEARVEVELGYQNFLRLGEETDLTFGSIDQRETEMDLKLGHLILRLFDKERNIVFTPHAVIELQKKGVYRVSVLESGETRLVVRRGTAKVHNQFRERKVKEGSELIIEGAQSAFTQVSGNYYEDSLDLWSDRRDASYISNSSHQYVGYRAGAYDLDAYGYWDSVGSYGNVWFPSVGASWVPYRAGRWCRYPRFGWTWISYEPWGWLPYHYGSWVYYRPYRRWGWVPGGFNSWFGAGVNFYFGSGHVGWAPWGYGRDRRHGSGNVVVVNNNNTTVNNTTIINTRDGNWRIPPRDGLTVVPEGAFANERPDRTLVTRVDDVRANLRPGLPENIRSNWQRPTRAGVTSPAGTGPNVSVVGGSRPTATAAPNATTNRRGSSWTAPAGATTGAVETNRPTRRGSSVEGSDRRAPTSRLAPDTQRDREDTNRWRVRPERPTSPSTRPSVSPSRSTESSRATSGERTGAGAWRTGSRDRATESRQTVRPSRPSVRPESSRSSSGRVGSTRPSRSGSTVSRGSSSRPSVRSSSSGSSRPRVSPPRSSSRPSVRPSRPAPARRPASRPPASRPKSSSKPPQLF